MIKTMHGFCAVYSNIATEIRIAHETGYDALETLEHKVLRYLDAGLKAEDLVPLFQQFGIRPAVINALKGVERVEPKERKQLMKDAERLCAAAEVIGFPTIQLVPLCTLRDHSYSEMMKLTARNIAEIADIGKQHGVRFQLEPISYSPIHSLSQSLELIDMVGRDNVAMVIDFWHLWAGRETTPDDVAKLDKSMIYGVHFCDGVRPEAGVQWGGELEMELRGYPPGKGDIPVQEWVDAVKATGFDGVWSSEFVSLKHWEMDPLDVAAAAKSAMEQYVCPTISA